MSRGSSNLAGGEGCFWVKDQGEEGGGGLVRKVGEKPPTLHYVHCMYM